MPTQDQLRARRGLGFIGERLFDPDIWHLSRRSVRTAMLVGIFACWIPLPIQMPIACGLALLLRCNLPLAASLCWVSNPFTLPAMVYLGFKLGAWMLGRPPLDLPEEISVSALLGQLGEIGFPFLLGSISAGLISGLAISMLVDLLWRVLVIRRWRRRLHGLGEDGWRQLFRARLLERAEQARRLFNAVAPSAINPDAGPALDPAQPLDAPDKSLPPG